MLLVNPPCHSNHDQPSLACGFADVTASVADLNTAPELANLMRPFQASCQSRSKEWVEKQGCQTFVVQDIAFQCSYAYLAKVGCAAYPRLPIPNYERFSSYPVFRRHWDNGSWAYPLLTSFGCPYGCTYCEAARSGWRARSYTETPGEIARYLPKVVGIADQLFNSGDKHVLRVCEILRGNTWMAVNGLRADRLTVAQAQAMSRSGCESVGLGVEYPDDQYLKQMGKGETLAEIERGIKIANDYFPSVSVYLISGFGDDRRALDWAAKWGVYVHLSVLNSVPFKQLPTCLDSPDLRLLRNRATLVRRYGTKAVPYLKMDLGKIWRRIVR